MNNLCANAFHVGVEVQGPAEAVECRHGVVLFEEALPHARGSAEMIGVDLQGLVAIADRVGVAVDAEVRDGALVPNFGEPRRLRYQCRGAVDRFLMTLGGVHSHDESQLTSLLLVAGSTPDFANAGLGKQSHAAIGVVQCTAHGRVRIVAAQVSQRQNRATAGHATADLGHPFESARCVSFGDGLGETGDVVVAQIGFVQLVDQGRLMQRLTHGRRFLEWATGANPRRPVGRAVEAHSSVDTSRPCAITSSVIGDADFLNEPLPLLTTKDGFPCPTFSGRMASSGCAVCARYSGNRREIGLIHVPSHT